MSVAGLSGENHMLAPSPLPRVGAPYYGEFRILPWMYGLHPNCRLLNGPVQTYLPWTPCELTTDMTENNTFMHATYVGGKN